MKYYQRLQPIQISRKETHIFHPILSKNFIINHPDNRSKRENERIFFASNWRYSSGRKERKVWISAIRPWNIRTPVKRLEFAAYQNRRNLTRNSRSRPRNRDQQVAQVAAGCIKSGRRSIFIVSARWGFHWPRIKDLRLSWNASN